MHHPRRFRNFLNDLIKSGEDPNKKPDYRTHILQNTATKCRRIFVQFLMKRNTPQNSLKSSKSFVFDGLALRSEPCMDSISLSLFMAKESNNFLLLQSKSLKELLAKQAKLFTNILSFELKKL
ncbi:hypothetical protein BpHYR1_034879 [Brachionus plicatilis]|uniref:Uncharacterized protein n=1 Tax=Brachionus plicatilis TaxID=10195 RepID=A0A3M7QC27_BRAPC|nr:hypothetical protein BpHYR1_034879 [Brachionus plicatilis]